MYAGCDDGTKMALKKFKRHLEEEKCQIYKRYWRYCKRNTKLINLKFSGGK